MKSSDQMMALQRERDVNLQSVDKTHSGFSFDILSLTILLRWTEDEERKRKTQGEETDVAI